MYATDSTFVVEPEDGKEGSRPLQAVITVVWALLATLLLFAFMGAIALVVI